MSLLGKKRTKRSKEDDQVRKILLIIIIFIVQEFDKLVGIKDEENQVKEEEKKENKQVNNIDEQKEEKNDIKIIENTINIPCTERIKNTTVKKESKNKNVEIKKDVPKLSLFNKDNDNIDIKVKKEIKEDNKQEQEKNPFVSLLTKDKDQNKNEKEDNNKKNENNIEKSLFDNINDKGKSLFGKIISKNDNNDKKENTKSLFDFPNKEEKKEKETKKENNQGSLFGNNNSIFTGGSLFADNSGKSLFGNNDTNNNENSIFSKNAGKSLFGNTDTNNNVKSLFSNNGGKSLFGDINNYNNPFSEIKGDVFAKSLFSKTQNKSNEKEGNLFEGEEENSENSNEGDQPKTKYVAEPLKAQDYSEYSKLFNLNINNLFLYNKTEKKYVSKGSGFFSIEKTKDEKSEKHQAVVVYRNHAGNKLVEGFLDKKFNKFDILSKDFNYVVCFGIIMMNDGKPEIGFIKIPFKNEENANNLKKSFEKAMEFIDKK